MAGTAPSGTDPHEHDHVLPDGTTVHVRPIRPDDEQRLLDMWERTSPASRRARFHGAFRLTENNVDRFTDLDPDTQFALVATQGRGEDERIIAVVRYAREPDDPDQADFAALVEDAHQGRGIGTALVRHVAEAAYEDGIETLVGDVLADNRRMLSLIRDIGLKYRRNRGPGGAGGVVRTDLGLELDDDFLEVVAEDERQAAEAALRRFFGPERVAVVGASRNRRSIGGLVFDHLVSGGFQGVVYPVNDSADHVQGVAAYPSLEDCPAVPDLVIVCVPAPAVTGIVDEAGELGVRAVCVVSAGFAEAGGTGRERQTELMSAARGHGLRIVGPNCMGLMNGAADVRMNGTFSDVFPRPGRLAFSSQSGALGLAVLEHAEDLGLGISSFISVGNKADISGNDLLLYWENDPQTDVLLLYLESFGNPRKFSRIARRVSRRKPIVAVKSGRSTAGVRAASSHTAAMSAGDVAVDALFRQTGVIRTDTLEELFDVATLLSHQPLPAGDRVGILTNAGGPGILAADACEAAGLEVPPLAEDTRGRLEGFLPEEAGISNPVDMIASATAERYAAGLRVLGDATEVDAVFVIFIPAGTTEGRDVARALAEAAEDVPDEVPVVSVFMSSRGVPEDLEEAQIPSFAFPEDAARALGRVARYADWRSRPLGEVVTPGGIDPARARRTIEAALQARTGASTAAPRTHARSLERRRPARGEDAGTWLTADEAETLLEAYGVPLAASRLVADADGAADARRELDGPVAVKVAAPVHKSDVGGVRLGLSTPDEVAAAVSDMDERLRAEGSGLQEHGYLVQEMTEGIVEMVVGVSHDPSFGPIVMTGLGGTLVELLEDVSVRITPLTDVDVEKMLAGLRMRPMLDGYRGRPPADVAALEDLRQRINAMVEDLPEIAELDLNPVFVRERGGGVAAVDARIRVTPA